MHLILVWCTREVLLYRSCVYKVDRVVYSKIFDTWYQVLRYISKFARKQTVG